MDITKKKILKTALIILLIIIILLLCSLFLGGRSFSKYKKNFNVSSSTEIAKPILNVEGDSNIKIDGIEDTIYDFSVKNYNGSNVSEVDMNYYIEIVNTSKADLDFILTKNGKTVSLKNNKTDLISLVSTIKQTDDYQLQIKYNNNPAILTDIDGSVQIKVEAIQSIK
ncbi:MAG: hypothetical protein K1W33_00675 [Clostridia bacterium]